MAFEGAQMVPVYDMNKSDGDGFMGGGAHWSVEQIDDVIRQYGIKCIGFNR